MIDSALFYASASLSVLPWRYIDGSKRPAIKWKHLQNRRLTAEEIRSWYEAHPHDNVGVITGAISDLIIIDCDDDDACQWAECNLPPTPWKVQTGRGVQLGYAHPGFTVSNRTKVGDLNLDLRGDGGYVAMPPSIHKSGRRYLWSGEPFDGNTVVDLPTYAPSWLPEPEYKTPQLSVLPGGQVNRSNAFDRASKWMEKRDPAIAGQAGDDHTYATACQLVRDFGLPRDEAMELMLQWNTTCEPPWTVQELNKKIDSALRSGQAAIGSKETIASKSNTSLTSWASSLTASPQSFPETSPSAAETPQRIPSTDMGNARRFALQHGGKVRYLFDTNYWYIWTGQQWLKDESGACMRLAKATALSIHEEAKTLEGKAQTACHKWAYTSQGSGRLTSMLNLAASEPGIPAMRDDFDKDAFRINTPSGVIDLRTGELLPAEPEMMMSMMTAAPYDPSARSSMWEDFVHMIFKGDLDLIRYMRQLAGYSLTADVYENLFVYLYGKGSNGKSTFINTLIKTFGDYAKSAPPKLIVKKRHEPHPTQFAFLEKLRLALCGEVGENEQLDTATVNHLAGGEEITARGMRRDFYSFSPTHTAWGLGNHMLRITDTSDGIWRRMKLIPFTYKIPESQKDASFPPRLLKEGAGILNWAVQGAIDYANNGFAEPEIVTQATSDYRKSEDHLGQWFEDCVNLEAGIDGGSTPHKRVRQSYDAWCEENKVKPLSGRNFNSQMQSHGYQRGSGGSRNWQGLVLKPQSYDWPSNFDA